jgi:hypothetical protein
MYNRDILLRFRTAFIDGSAFWGEVRLVGLRFNTTFIDSLFFDETIGESIVMFSGVR